MYKWSADVVTVMAIKIPLKLLNQSDAKLKLMVFFPHILFSLTFFFTSGCFIGITFNHDGLIVITTSVLFLFGQ